MKNLLNMKNGGIENTYTYDSCETNSIDKSKIYKNVHTLELAGYQVEVTAEANYGYALSSGDLMKLFLYEVKEIAEMTEYIFIKWLDAMLKEFLNEDSYTLRYKKIDRSASIK